jgi:N-acetylmuramoyl-L-alanine amidase
MSLTKKQFFLLLFSCIYMAIAFHSPAALAISQDDLNSVTTNTPFYDPNATQCSDSTTSSTTTSTGTTATASQAQTQNAELIIGVAKTDNLGQAGALIGLMVSLDEASLLELANDNVPLSETNPNKQGDGHDHYSLGIFQQQITTDWSTISDDPNNQAAVNQLMTPAYNAEAFFGSPAGSGAPAALSKGLQDVPGWQSMEPWVAAQTVQASGTAGGLNYKAQLGAAQTLITQYYASSPAVPLNVPITGGGTTTPTTTGTSGSCCSSSSSTTTGTTTDSATTSTSGSHTIVLDPGHATQANELVDPATDEPVFDYSNPIEQQQVWTMSQDLTTKLEALGYTVLNTKTSENDTTTNLKARAEVGNTANAALGVSLHTTPGSTTVGNDVFYPNVGDYLVKVNGQHDVYANQALSATDKTDAGLMATNLTQAESGVTFDAGSYDQLFGPITRAGPAGSGITMQGTMLVTQYFATVPWVYVEQYQDAGAGTTSAAAMQDYENGVLKGIEAIVPITNTASTGSSGCTATLTSSTSCATNSSSTATGPNSAILCEAEKYAGVYYSWGGGHEAYSAFRQGCPYTALAVPSGSTESSAAAASTGGSPGPCGTDCSGLVSMALDGAYNLSFNQSVTHNTGVMAGTGAQYWQSIPIAQAQAGDIVTTNAGGGSVGDGHVEIVDHVSNGIVYTFGSHYTGATTGPASAPASYWTQGAWRWMGPTGAPAGGTQTL